MKTHLDEVSMNLRLTFSRCVREVWTWSDLRRVSARFLVPTVAPLTIRKSFLMMP